MAGLSSFLKVTVLGDSKPLNTAMRKAMRDIDQLERSVKKTAVGISRAMGAIGVGFGIAGLTNMAKAAADDRESMVKLETAIRNATNATDDQIAASDKYVQSLSNQLGILDDDLRPALQKLVLATGDLAQAQSLLPLAADLAASANVDLTTATNVLSKAVNGNMTALYKLMPALKGVNDPMAELQKLTAGSAEAAANSNPWKRLEVVFGNLTETIGTYLLPYLSRLSEWLATEEGQDKLETLANGFGQLFTNIGNLIQFLGDTIWISATITGLVVLIKTYKAVYLAIKAIYTATKAAAIADFVANGLKAGKSWVAIVSAITSAGVAGAFFVGVDRLIQDFDDSSLSDIGNFEPKKITYSSPKTFQKQSAGSAVETKKMTAAMKQAQTTLQAAVQTVETKLAQVRQAVIEMATKFFNAVDLAFGIVQRGASKVFRADRYVRELKRMQAALADFQTNLAKLQAIGGKAAQPLLNQILGMAPEEGAAILRGFAESPQLFTEAINATTGLANQGAAVGRAQSLMNGNQTEVQMLAELRLLRAELASGKNTYNIKSEMSAEQILASIRAWEKKSKKKVLR
jgi:hypothetical protein